jgi:3-hydroxy-9,10-secoandrosta-1,3,5(10)-triene-9,17-dione monooxygenase reductase component
MDTRQYRDTIGLFPTGVAVIAVQNGDEVQAMTATAVNSLSLDPMLLLFCPAKKARLSRLLKPAMAFSVNLLRSDQQSISTFFAGGWREPMPPPYRFVRMGDAPRLEGCLATLACTIHSIADGGDHWLVIGTVTSLKQGIIPHEPLLFYQGRYGQLRPEAAGPAPDLGAVIDEPTHIYYDAHT